MSNFHSVYNDPLIGGLRVGQAGASKYILVDGKPITGGYHSFHLENGTLMGTLGATTEVVKHQGEKL